MSNQFDYILLQTNYIYYFYSFHVQTTLIFCAVALCSNHCSTSPRHRMYQVLDSVHWDGLPCSMEQLPQSLQTTSQVAKDDFWAEPCTD